MVRAPVLEKAFPSSPGSLSLESAIYQIYSFFSHTIKFLGGSLKKNSLYMNTYLYMYISIFFLSFVHYQKMEKKSKDLFQCCILNWTDFCTI